MSIIDLKEIDFKVKVIPLLRPTLKKKNKTMLRITHSAK